MSQSQLWWRWVTCSCKTPQDGNVARQVRDRTSKHWLFLRNCLLIGHSRTEDVWVWRVGSCAWTTGGENCCKLTFMPYIQENEEDVYTSLLPNSIPLFFSVNESPGFVNHCPVLLRDFISLHLFPCRISMVCRVSLHIIQVSYKALVCPPDWLAKLL